MTGFIKSRTSIEIQRRCTTLLTMLCREEDDKKGSKRERSEDISRETTPAASKKTKKGSNKVVEDLKRNQAAKYQNGKRAGSVSSTGSKSKKRR